MKITEKSTYRNFWRQKVGRFWEEKRYPNLLLIRLRLLFMGTLDKFSVIIRPTDDKKQFKLLRTK